MGLTNLDYKPGYKEYTFYKYWLASNGHTSSSDRNDTAVLEAFQPEEIHSQYIIQVTGKGYTVINHSSKVYRIPDTHECIDGNQPLHLIINIDARQKPDPDNLELSSLDNEKITREDLISRILVACADTLYSVLSCMASLNNFVLASSSNINKCS